MFVGLTHKNHSLVGDFSKWHLCLIGLDTTFVSKRHFSCSDYCTNPRFSQHFQGLPVLAQFFLSISAKSAQKRQRLLVGDGAGG
jgi:hypothetical protein